MRPRRPGSRGGFTLVELLVGLTVSALALTAGFTALAFVGERSRHADQAAAAALEGAAARGTLVDWLAGARLRGAGRQERFQGLDAEEHGVPSDELTFPTTARTPLQVAETLVRLYIDADLDTPEQGLVAELSERMTDEPRRVQLLPRVSRLEVRYLPDVEEATEWLPSWLNGNQLPRAVELTLGVEPPDTLPPLLRFPIRVPLGTLR